MQTTAGCDEVYRLTCSGPVSYTHLIEKCGFRYQFTKETTNVIGMTNKTVFYALKKEEWLAFSGEKEFA